MSNDPTAEARDLYDRGHAALAANDFAEAVECFSRAIALRPEVAAAYRARARAYVLLNRRTDALADLERAIRLKPDDPAAFAERAELLFRQKAYADAIADCDKVLSLDSGWAAATGLRAQCHAALGDTEKALADFAAALEHDPDHAAEYYLARAALWLDTAQYSHCVSDCTATLNLVPGHAGALCTRGLAYRELKDLGAAEADLSEAVRLEPESTLARLALATIRVDARRFAVALVDCDEVLRRSPNSGQAFVLRGIANQHLGNLEGAIADFTDAARLIAASPTPLRLRAGVHTERGDYAAAVRDLLAALKRQSRDAALFNQLAWILATAPDDTVRNCEQAKECATRACELTGWFDPPPLDTLAAAWAECGEFEQAVNWQERAIAFAPPELVDEYGARWQLYREKKPYRMA